MRHEFGRFARAWSRVLSQAQRDAWNLAAAKVQSKERLESGPLTGQQLFQGLNSARACTRKYNEMLLLPTPQPVFSINPVENLIITNGEKACGCCCG